MTEWTRWTRLQGVARTRKRRAVLALFAVAITLCVAAGIEEVLTPRVYFISRISLRHYIDDHVPEEVTAPLEPMLGEPYAEKRALLDEIRVRVGDQAWITYQSALERRVRTEKCGPTSSPRKVYSVKDSRGHPLYGRYGVELVIPQAQLPPVATQLEFLPHGAGVLVLGKFGHVVWYGPDWRTKLAFQVPDVYPGGEDVGALGLALDPGFAENHMFYVGYVDTWSIRNVIERYVLSEDGRAVLASGVEVIHFDKDNNAAIHGIGSLTFTPEGAMLVQVGDQGQHAQAWADREGKILSIVPDRGLSGGYQVSPRPQGERARLLLRYGSPIIVANGFRSPFSGTSWRGHLIIGDVGGGSPWSVEKIDVYSQPGENFGWGGCTNIPYLGDFTPPAIYYRRGDPGVIADDPLAPENYARSVIVGVVYDGAAVDRYRGTLDRRLIYGDFFLGFLRGARLNDRAEVEDDVFLTHQFFVSSMRVGPDGYIYGVTAFGDKGMFRLLLKQPPQR